MLKHLQILPKTVSSWKTVQKYYVLKKNRNHSSCQAVLKLFPCKITEMSFICTCSINVKLKDNGFLWLVKISCVGLWNTTYVLGQTHKLLTSYGNVWCHLFYSSPTGGANSYMQTDYQNVVWSNLMLRKYTQSFNLILTNQF